MTAAERHRLVGILARLGSDFAGERAAAGLLASRMLQANNLTWDDVVLPVALRSPTWRAEVAFAQRHAGWLRPWERDFVASVTAQSRLSPKRLAILREIATKLWARGAT
jgi:hypothetical protein